LPASPHEPDQLLVDDLDDLLARGEAVQDLLPHGALADVFHKLLDHLVIHIRFEQGHPDFFESLLDVFLCEPSLPLQLFEGSAQLLR